MATVVSLINMKGGVGKTTLAFQIAHAAFHAGKRVLVIDIDPQANLSQSMLGSHRYMQHFQKRSPTIVQVFDAYQPATKAVPGPRKVSVDDIIIKDLVYSGEQRRTLDLIPSRLELARVLKQPRSIQSRLARFVAQIDDRYDLILVDCPPTESLLTDAAYFASRFVLVPVKPEFLAAIGLPLLARSLSDFRQSNKDHEIEICGILFNHSSDYGSGPEKRQSISEVRRIASENGWPVFPTELRYSRSYAKSARDGTPLPWTRRVHWPVKQEFQAFAIQFFRSIDLQ
jgi:chromosome partitioning protein